jgi:hypothetical protein
MQATPIVNYRKINTQDLPPGAWGALSKVRDTQGFLLPAYRGQHGAFEHWTETALGSLSFGSVEAASWYAMEPNNREHVVQAPKVFPVFLDIRKPFLVSFEDPFVDLSHHASVFGMPETKRVALKYKDHIYNTQAWEDVAVAAGFGTIEAVVEHRPDLLMGLCFELYNLLDDAAEVALLRGKGFDGAIYGGSGQTALETEYRVFSESQVRSIWDARF